MRRGILCLLVLFMVNLGVSGCKSGGGKESDLPSDSEKEFVEAGTESITDTVDPLEEKKDMVSRIAEIMECDRDTAQSIYNTLDRAGVKNITGIEKDFESKFGELYITSEDGQVYYVFFGFGNTIQEIRLNDKDGKRIYQIII